MNWEQTSRACLAGAGAAMITGAYQFGIGALNIQVPSCLPFVIGIPPVGRRHQLGRDAGIKVSRRAQPRSPSDRCNRRVNLRCRMRVPRVQCTRGLVLSVLIYPTFSNSGQALIPGMDVPKLCAKDRNIVGVAKRFSESGSRTVPGQRVMVHTLGLGDDGRVAHRRITKCFIDAVRLCFFNQSLHRFTSRSSASAVMTVAEFLQGVDTTVNPGNRIGKRCFQTVGRGDAQHLFMHWLRLFVRIQKVRDFVDIKFIKSIDRHRVLHIMEVTGRGAAV